MKSISVVNRLVLLLILAGCSSTEDKPPTGPIQIALVTAVEGSPSVLRRNQHYIIDVQSRIFTGDIVETGADSRALLTMQDGSVISLGNESHLVFHEFDVHKEERTRASLALSRGAIRLSSSDTIDKGTFEIRTPVATIRFTDGDIWTGFILGENALDVVMIAGEGVTITNGRFLADISLPGEGLSVIRGSGPQAVSPWPQSKIIQATNATAVPAP